jgi:hypothetical protein
MATEENLTTRYLGYLLTGNERQHANIVTEENLTTRYLVYLLTENER